MVRLFSFDSHSPAYGSIKIYIGSIDTFTRCGYNNGEDQNWRSIMRDYSKYEKTPVLFSGAEKKFEIIIDGFRYIVKFQKNSEVGLTFNYVSEYLGCSLF